jgi:hypothetical protein
LKRPGSTSQRTPDDAARCREIVAPIDSRDRQPHAIARNMFSDKCCFPGIYFVQNISSAACDEEKAWGPLW